MLLGDDNCKTWGITNDPHDNLDPVVKAHWMPCHQALLQLPRECKQLLSQAMAKQVSPLDAENTFSDSFSGSIVQRGHLSGHDLQ